MVLTRLNTVYIPRASNRLAAHGSPALEGWAWNPNRDTATGNCALFYSYFILDSYAPKLIPDFKH